MTKIQIEDNIAIPSKVFGRALPRVSVFPFDKLEIGQSFFLPATSKDMKKVRAKLTTGVNQANKGKVKTFTLRTLPDGVRVWRVK